MNPETEQKVSRPEFENLFQEISQKRKRLEDFYDESCLAEIGRVVVKFARLEDSIKIHIGLMMKAQQPLSQVATTEASFRNLISMLGALCQHNYGDSGDVVTLLNAISDADAIRNQLLHSLWFGHEDKLSRLKTTAKPKKGLHQSVEEYSSEDLKRIATWIDKIDTTLDGFLIGKISERLVTQAEGADYVS